MLSIKYEDYNAMTSLMFLFQNAVNKRHMKEAADRSQE